MPLTAPSELYLFSVASTEAHIFFDDPDPADAKDFRIERSPAGAGTWTAVTVLSARTPTRGLVNRKRATRRYFRHAGLSAGGFDYRVRSEHAGEVSAWRTATVTVRGQDYWVDGAAGSDTNAGTQASPWATLAKAINTVPADQGHRIRWTGSFTLAQRLPDLRRGVSFKGAGWAQSRITYTQNSAYDEGQGAFFFDTSPVESPLDAVFEDYEVSGGSFQGRRAFILDDAKGFVLQNLRVLNTFYEGIHIRGMCRYFAILSCTVNDAGYAPPMAGESYANEYNNFYGGISIKASIRDWLIADCTLRYTRGYGIKIYPSYRQLAVAGDYNTVWDTARDGLVENCTGRGGSDRLWQGTTAPGFAIEVWNVDTDRVAVVDCDMDNQLSYEKKNKFRGTHRYSIGTFDCYLRSLRSSMMESSNSDLETEGCVLDLRSAVGNVYSGFGDANGQPNNQGAENMRFRRNLILMGRFSESIFSTPNRHNGFKFEHNVVVYQNGLPRQLINAVNYGDGDYNKDWADFSFANNVIIHDGSTPGEFRLARKTTGNSYYDMGTGVMSFTGASRWRNNFLRHMGTNPPTGITISGNNAAVPQVAGGTDIYQAYKPAASSNLADAGLDVGLAFAGAAPDAGWFETGLAGGGNQPPSVSVSVASATVIAGADITVNVVVSDADGTVAQVELLVNGAVAQTDGAAPFGPFTIPSPAAGSYAISARATDNLGLAAVSGTVMVAVRAANTPPVVALAAPVAGQVAPAGGQLLLAATATDADGTVARVEFLASGPGLAGTQLVGTRTAAPWAVNWTPPQAGSYAVSARATDNYNATTTTPTATVSVQAMAGTFLRGRNLGGSTAGAPAVAVAGNNWLGHDDAVVRGGVKWENPGPGNPVLNPVPDAATESMLRTYLAANEQTAAVVEEAVPNGRYLVYAWALEDNAPATFDLWVQGAKVLEDHLLPNAGAPGAWQRMGPFACDVTNGVLRVEGAGGPINLCGLEIWRVGASVQITQGAGSYLPGQAVAFAVALGLQAGQTAQRVEYYNGGVLIGQNAASPYGFTWTGAPAGTHLITARLVDGAGGVTVSPAVTVAVGAANTPPVAALAAPAGVFLAGDTAVFTGTASDNGTVAVVELFHSQSVKVGEVRAAQGGTVGAFSIPWQNLPAGAWSVFARATDNLGLAADSPAVSFTVAAPPAPLPKGRYAYEKVGGKLYIQLLR